MGCELRLLGIGIVLTTTVSRPPARRTIKRATRGHDKWAGQDRDTVAAGEDGIGWYEPGGRAFPEICVDPFF